jgi:hypothetical protein
MSEENITRKLKIFISYSHEDYHWKEYIKGYFNPNLFEVWDDGRIKVGDNWYYEISDYLYRANIALLLLSRDFINSEFIEKEELPVFFERHKKGELLIVKVFIRQYPYETVGWITEKGKSLQGYISPKQPLTNFIDKNSYIGLKESSKLEDYISELVDKIIEAYNIFKIKQLRDYHTEIETLQNNFEKDYIDYPLSKLIDIAKDSIDDFYWDKIEKAFSRKDLIKKLWDIKQSEKFLEYLKYYEDKEEDKPSQESKQEDRTKKSDGIFVHFRQDNNDDNKYYVDIYARYVKGSNITQRDIIIEDINNPKEQQKFMQNFHQFRKNIPIHLILPSELYLENFRLWKDKIELVELFHPIYIHSETRYTKDLDEYLYMIEDEWEKEYKPDEILSNMIELLETRECRYGIRTKKIGICYKFLPSPPIIDEHLEIAKIALWFQKNSTKPDSHIRWIGKNFDNAKLKELPDKLQECDYASLLWDDMSMLVDLKRELET